MALAVPALAALVAQPVDWSLTALAQVMGGVWCVHSLDRLIEPGRVQRRAGAWLKPALLAGVVLGGLGAAGLAILDLIQDRMDPRLVILAALGLSYRWLARLPLAKAVVIAICWTLALALVVPALGWSDPRLLAWAAIVWGAATLCDLPDREHDRAQGRGSVPAVLGPRLAWILAVTAMLGGAVAAWPEAPALAASGAMALPLLACWPWSQDALVFPLLVDGALALPGVVVLILTLA